MRVIFSAPYRNGILLTVPTVMVMPARRREREGDTVATRSWHIKTPLATPLHTQLTQQIVGRTQLLEIQKEKALDEAPEIAEHKEKYDKRNHVRHFQ